MTEQPIKVRRLERKHSASKMHLIVIPVLLLLAVAAALSIVSLSNSSLFFSPSAEVVIDGNQTIIRVPAGGDLQAAIDRAKGGDIIELEAGAAYSGRINLPVKPINEFITIQTSAAGRLPADQKVTPAQVKLLARITSPGKGEPAVSAENGAHHYRFVGIEFTPANADYVYNLVLFGGDHQTLADVPHQLELDRCYLHPHQSGTTRRAVALNSADTVIKNSYFEGFAFAQEETQAICGWTGTKNVRINDNHIEAGAENILIGGADPVSAELIPADIEIRGNLLLKPDSWRGKYTLKTLFEIKNAKRVRFTGNYLENNPIGSAFRITVRNQDGKAPFSTIEDVLIRDNIIVGAGEGINILGKDDVHPSRTLTGLQFINNLLLDIGGERFEGGGYFLQINDGRDILIANNTVFQTGNIATFYGVNPENFVFSNNIVGHGNYGVHGLGAVRSSGVARRFFRDNVIVNNRNVDESGLSVPPNSFLLKSYREVKFADLDRRDFRLAATSGLRGRGANRTDIGADPETIARTMPPELFSRLSR